MPTSAGSFRAICTVECDHISELDMHSAATQSIVACVLNGTSTHTCYHTSVIWKILAPRVMQLSKRRQPVTHYQQVTAASSPVISLEKRLSFGELYAQSEDTRFAQGPMLSLETDTASCFPWRDRLTLFIFRKMSSTYESGYHGLSLFFPSTWCSVRKSGQDGGQRNLASALPPRP